MHAHPPPIGFCVRASGVTFFVRTPAGDVVLGTLDKGPDADRAADVVVGVCRALTLVTPANLEAALLSARLRQPNGATLPPPSPDEP